MTINGSLEKFLQQKLKVCDILLLQSEIPSGMCAKLRTEAASKNRDHARNLILVPAHLNVPFVKG